MNVPLTGTVANNTEQSYPSDPCVETPWKGLAPDHAPAGGPRLSRRGHPWDDLATLAPPLRTLATQRAQNQLLLDRQEQIQPLLDALCAAYVCGALEKMGEPLQAHTTIDFEAQVERLGVLPAHRATWRRMLGWLTEEGYLEALPGGWRVLQTPPRRDPRKSLQMLCLRRPEYWPLLLQVARCGRQLASLLRGETAAEQLLYPDAHQFTPEYLFQDHPQWRFTTELAGAIVAPLVAPCAETTALRLLTLCGGLGGLTAQVLPRLTGTPHEFHFTETSEALLVRAERRFHDCPHFHCHRLDIHRSLVEQGFSALPPDLIFASHCLHLVADVRQILQHIHSLLVPEGLLVLLEPVRPHRVLELIFGLTVAWEARRDRPLRPEHPYLSAATWQALLREAGFRAVEILTTLDNGKELDTALILAKA